MTARATSSGTGIASGAGAPSNGTGSDGQFYIDTTNTRLYGPKAAGAWPGTYVQLANTYRGDFATSTAYKQNEFVTRGGILYAAKADFASGGSFSSSDWTALTIAASSVQAVGRRISASLLRGQLAATNNGPYSTTFGAFSGSDFTVRQRFTVPPTGMADLRLYYANWEASAGTESAVGNSITVTAAIEAGGATRPVFFPGGTRSITLEGGGIVESQPVGVELDSGATYYVRTRVVYTGNCPASVVYMVTANGDGYSAGNVVDSTGGMSSTFGAGGLYGPFAITGEPLDTSVRQIGILGDSIAAGTGDTTINRGYIRLALGSNFPVITTAISGDKATSFAGTHYRRASLYAACDYAIEQYGINDCNQGRTAAQVEADRLTIWKALAKRGVQTYAATITPYTTSTDSWVTTVNQTKAMTTGETARIAVNAWIRDGAPIDATTLAVVATGTNTNVLRAGATGHPAAGYFDIAGLAETAQDSGIWKAGYTGDGLHPNVTGHTALAAGVTTGLFV